MNVGLHSNTLQFTSAFLIDMLAFVFVLLNLYQNMCLLHVDIIYYLIVLSIFVLTYTCGMITFKIGFHILSRNIKCKIICVYSLDYGKCYPKGILTDCLIQFNVLILGQMAVPVKCGKISPCLSTTSLFTFIAV